MTLKEFLHKVFALCNDETKDLKVVIMAPEGELPVFEIWHYKLKNDYVEINEIRIS